MKVIYKTSKIRYQKSVWWRFFKIWPSFRKKNFFSILTKNDTFLNFLVKNLKNQGFFDFKRVYRPVEISGRKKNWPKIGQSIYFWAQKILDPHLKNLDKIWKFVRGGKKGPFFPPPTTLKGILLKNA